MKKPAFLSRANLIRAAVLACCILLSFLVGGVVGYGKGFQGCMFHQGTEAWATVMVLEGIRDGRSEATVSYLETKLNSQIVSCGVGEKGEQSIFNIVGWTRLGQQSRVAVRGLMAKVADYRKRHPFPHPDKASQDFLNAILRKHAGDTETQPSRATDAAVEGEGDAERSE